MDFDALRVVVVVGAVAWRAKSTNQTEHSHIYFQKNIIYTIPSNSHEKHAHMLFVSLSPFFYSISYSTKRRYNVFLVLRVIIATLV